MARFPQPGEQAQSCCYPNCHAEVTSRIDVPLCGKHCLKVHATVAAMLTVDIRTVLPKDVALPPQERRVGYVYFVRMGDRVKIGHSLDPAKRLRVIPHEEVLALTEGQPRTRRPHTAGSLT